MKRLYKYCCGPCKITKFCTNCTCLGVATHDGVPNFRIGDGFCDDELNTEECNFDGGDCCGHCVAVTVTLKNKALVAQGKDS